MNCTSDYLDSILDRRSANFVINEVVQYIKDSRVEFDSIAFCGMSGALIAPIVGFLLNKPILMVRKEDKSHSSHKVEGYEDTRRYIIIDDFICSGDTIRNIVTQINCNSKHSGHTKAKPVAIFLYHTMDNRSFMDIEMNDGEIEVPIYSTWVDGEKMVMVSGRWGCPLPDLTSAEFVI